ncbi:MAG: YdcF family protein [Anaerolineae bacterium]|nr:YdcF family protein [Anaerolineae bacterium]
MTDGPPAPEGRRRWLRRWRWLALLGPVLLILAGPLWLPLLGRFLVVSDPLQPADALVPLAGGRQRVVYGAELFNDGYARWFVATDMLLNVPGVRASYSELVQQEAVWQGVPRERILLLSRVADDTYQEAAFVRELAEEQGWQSLLVVTDPFHTRRARIMFRQVFADSGVSVVIYPVSDHWYQPDSWWKSGDGLRETWMEYSKLALYLVGYR